MPELLDHIAFLSREIGPRPAGTEEEQQAATYISQSLQRDAGLSTTVEDFSSESNGEAPKAICALFTLFITVLSVLFPILAIPALLVTIITAILFVLEATEHPFILSRLSRGVSQNVVARFDPGYSVEASSARRRKIILVAHYDSGKVRPELNGPILGLLPLLSRLSLYAMVFVPVFLLVRFFFFLYADGALGIFLNIITTLALILVAIPVVLALVHRLSAYNDAANCNASGVAVLLEVARRVGRGNFGSQGGSGNTARNAMVYGEDAARAAGLVPDGAQLVYAEPSMPQAPQWVPQTEEDRLAAAKDAIAAMTGRPVVQRANASVADNLVHVGGMPTGASFPPVFTGEGAAAPQDVPYGGMPNGALDGGGTHSDPVGVPYQPAQPDTSQAPSGWQGSPASPDTASAGAGSAFQPQGAQPAPGAVAEAALDQGFATEAGQQGEGATGGNTTFAAEQSPAEPTVPEWYRKAQENAKRPKDPKPVKVQRSLYADALDAAASERPTLFNKATRAVDAETESRLKQMRDEIMEVSAPQIAREAVPADQEGALAPQGAGTPPDADHTTAMAPISIDDLRERYGQEAGATQGYPDATAWADAQALQQSPLAAAIPALSGSEAVVYPVQSLPAIYPGAQPRGPIVLPDIDLSEGYQAPPVEATKQRAPVLEDGGTSRTAAQGLLGRLPSIDPSVGTALFEAPEGAAAPQPGGRPDLRSLLPSISGTVQGLGQGQQALEAVPGAVPGRAAMPDAFTTGPFDPSGQAEGGAFGGISLEGGYVDDVGGQAEAGAFADSDYVEMPKKRGSGFLGKLGFGKNKNKGQGDSEPLMEDDDNWQGGAFSRKRAVNQDGFDEAGADAGLPQDGFYRQDEMSQVYQFHNSGLDTEIWFVALGSELANSSGMRAFLTEHGQDLRGSVIINLRALGAGSLCYLEKEGTSSNSDASSRMKRFVTKAASTLGMNVRPATIPWMNSATTVAVKKGYQALSIAGMQGAKPARFAQKDDILENIEEATLQQNTDFVMELLKNI